MSKASSKGKPSQRTTDRGRSAAGRRGKSPVAAARGGPSTWMVAGIVLILLFAGAVGFAVYHGQHSDGVLVIPAGGDSTGVTVGKADAPATIDIYLDLQCPVCRAFELQAGSQIDQFVSGGQAKVIYHPLGFLDRMSSTGYSSRAAAATGCAADAGVFAPYLSLLYQNQPPEGGDGLTDDQLIAFGKQAGAADPFAACVRDHRYATWVTGLTDKASQAGINATPTVKVNGREIDHSPTALTDAVRSAG